jgi:hypothetical protein
VAQLEGEWDALFACTAEMKDAIASVWAAVCLCIQDSSRTTQGHFAMAQAKNAMGYSAISATQYDSNMKASALLDVYVKYSQNVLSRSPELVFYRTDNNDGSHSFALLTASTTQSSPVESAAVGADASAAPPKGMSVSFQKPGPFNLPYRRTIANTSTAKGRHQHKDR